MTTQNPPAGPGNPYTPTYAQSPSMSQHASFADNSSKPAEKDGEKKEQRLIVVSNRLPVTISKDEDGEYHFKVSLRVFDP